MVLRRQDILSGLRRIRNPTLKKPPAIGHHKSVPLYRKNENLVLRNLFKTIPI